jgi:hypothetical protein
LKPRNLTPRVDGALREGEPDLALRALVRDLLTEGHSRRELANALESYRGSLEEQGREDDDERILDVIAVLTGWASKTAVRNLLPPPCVAPHATSLS